MSRCTDKENEGRNSSPFALNSYKKRDKLSDSDGFRFKRKHWK